MSKIKLADRLSIFPEYVFSKLGKTVADIELKSNRKVLNFGPGNPDVTPSVLYIDKFCEFIKDKDAHLYPGFGANSEFQNALIKWYQKRFNVTIETSELFPLLGAKDGIAHLPLALLNEKDEVLVPDPGYPAFSHPTLMIGAIPIYYDLVKENNFKIDLNKLEATISNKTKFMWVNFPSNPTGQVAKIDELKQIVEIARRHNIFIVYDNAYSEITFDGFIAPSILEVDGAKDIAVEIGSFSKTFSFAGFRLGWVVGNKDVVQALAKVKSQMDSGLSTPLQKLGAFSLNNFDKKWYTQMIATYQKRRITIGKRLKSLGLRFSLPKGGLYIWAKIPDEFNDSEKFCISLLEKKQILLTPGTAFGKNGKRYVRISISVNIDNINDYF